MIITKAIISSKVKHQEIGGKEIILEILFNLLNISL